ncbi:MAG: thermonuclease family protein [Myxococcota bacterium]
MILRPRWPIAAAAVLGLAAGVGLACDGDPDGSACGPTEAVVARVIDGDTVELDSGERVRYLLIDTPESTGGKDDCFGQEATELNRMLVEGQRVTLRYDVECTDPFDRLLAYVEVNGREVNSLLIERGAACVLSIPPNGQERREEFEDLEREARDNMVGVWGACEDVTCD